LEDSRDHGSMKSPMSEKELRVSTGKTVTGRFKAYQGESFSLGTCLREEAGLAKKRTSGKSRMCVGGEKFGSSYAYGGKGK